jgi:acyl-CoA synthetase
VYRLGPIQPGIQFEDASGSAVAAAPAPVTDPDKIVLLAFTSGSTGEPKGVMHSDNTLLANARAMARDWRHDQAMILLCLSPLTHAIGTIAMAQSLVSGFELVLNDVPRGKSIMDWLLESEATYVMGVPTHAMDVLAEAERRGMENIGNLRIFYMGGAAIPRQTINGLIARGITPQNVYGMTENGAHHYTRPDDDVATMVGSCGRACGCYEVTIWDPEDADRAMPAGQIGEIGGRGACLMLGYFADQAATESAMNQAGWFMTGDLGRVDAGGNLQIVGRKKDIIIRGGKNIYPSRIEDAARSHSAVLQATAFPVADERLGEKVALAVVTRDAKTVDADELLRHLDDSGISRYDMPEFFTVLEKMPLTASGKIFKRGLVELVQQGEVKLQAVRWKG